MLRLFRKIEGISLTPITGIDGNVDLLLGSDLNEEQRPQVLAIRHSAQKLLEMVDDTLEYSHSGGAGLELREVPFDLPVLVEGVAAHIQEEARGRG